MRRFTLFGVVMVVLAGTALFQMKYTIEAKDRLLQDLKVQLEEDRHAVRVLEAEWTYLNSPEYLQDMTARFLLLGPTSPKRVYTGFSEVPWRGKGEGPIRAIADFVIPTPKAKPEAIALRQAALEARAELEKSVREKTDVTRTFSPGGGDD